MIALEESQYSAVQPLFKSLSAFHLCGWAVLCGAAPGKVWVDNADQPGVAFVESSEGSYLVGDPNRTDGYPAIKETIPYLAYLICDPPAWEQVLGQVWSNTAARRHEREHYVFRSAAAPEWRSRVPEGLHVQRIDEDFFSFEHLEHFDEVAEWVDGWRSRMDFLQRGGGAVVIHENTIVSWSLMDCALGDRCEIGIVTDMRYRRQGLAKLAVSAMLEICLEQGYREVGWQCLRTNVGSAATARSLGFQKERDYLAFSCFLPAESTGDLSNAEYADWAVHYERFAPEHTWLGLLAAEAWSMAGNPDRAVENLRRLKQAGWKARPEWIEGNRNLENLAGNEEAVQLLKEIL